MNSISLTMIDGSSSGCSEVTNNRRKRGMDTTTATAPSGTNVGGCNSLLNVYKCNVNHQQQHNHQQQYHRVGSCKRMRIGQQQQQQKQHTKLENADRTEAAAAPPPARRRRRRVRFTTDPVSAYSEPCCSNENENDISNNSRSGSSSATTARRMALLEIQGARNTFGFQIYCEMLAASYLACGSPSSSSNGDGQQQQQQQEQQLSSPDLALSIDHATVLGESWFRGLEVLVLPTLAQDRGFGRLNHIHTVVQSYKLLKTATVATATTPDSSIPAVDQLNEAIRNISMELSTSASRFARFMGLADEVAVRNDLLLLAATAAAASSTVAAAGTTLPSSSSSLSQNQEAIIAVVEPLSRQEESVVKVDLEKTPPLSPSSLTPPSSPKDCILREIEESKKSSSPKMGRVIVHDTTSTGTRSPPLSSSSSSSSCCRLQNNWYPAAA